MTTEAASTSCGMIHAFHHVLGRRTVVCLRAGANLAQQLIVLSPCSFLVPHAHVRTASLYHPRQ